MGVRIFGNTTPLQSRKRLTFPRTPSPRANPPAVPAGRAVVCRARPVVWVLRAWRLFFACRTRPVRSVRSVCRAWSAVRAGRVVTTVRFALPIARGRCVLLARVSRPVLFVVVVRRVPARGPVGRAFWVVLAHRVLRDASPVSQRGCFDRSGRLWLGCSPACVCRGASLVSRSQSHEHVFENGHAAELPDPLQGAGDAVPVEVMGPGPERPPVQRQRTGLRRDKAADHVEERGLAGPVGPDDADNPPRRNPQRDIVKSSQAAEADSQMMQSEPVFGGIR